MLEPAVVAPPDFLTLDEAAAVLRVGRSTAYREANAFEASGGKTGIPVVRYGNLFRAALPARGTGRWPDDRCTYE